VKTKKTKISNKIIKKKHSTLITADMNINEVIEKNPEVTNIFSLYGFHCIGCQIATFETIAQGAKVHAMTPQTLKMMLRDANQIIKENESSSKKQTNSEVEITDKASNKFYELIKKTNKKEGYIRIAIQKGGCFGIMYSFTVESRKKKGDIVIKKNTVQFIASSNVYNHLKGSKIDFLQTLEGTGFKVTNPQDAANRAINGILSNS
jgi:iron-sulfur cluster assembly accessory protein